MGWGKKLEIGMTSFMDGPLANVNIYGWPLSKCNHFLQYGDTPLHTGARYGHAGVIRILVSADCNPSEQNKVNNA